MTNQKGFTLMELLLVLSTFLVIASISVILLFRPQYYVVEKERFLSQFKADFFYSQQYAIANQKSLTFYISPKDNRYFVKELPSNITLIDRTIPKSITVEQGTMGTMIINFGFDPSGEINRFGTIYFIVGKQRYKITFQIGAGRFYVVKE